MAEVLVEFPGRVVSQEGIPYVARACGAEAPDGLWQGWIEFTPLDGGEPVRSGRETTQPSRRDAQYWATGLTDVYLEGALTRALRGSPEPPTAAAPAPAFDGPAPRPAAPPQEPEGVLNPFSVLQKGEVVLRRQLSALSSWHLLNIIRAHALSEQDPEALGRMPPAELLELIVAGVKVQSEALETGD